MRAVELQDALDLGKALLAANRPQEAQRVFEEDLVRFPENGWSLHGLATAERALGNDASAATLEKTFEEVWAKADITR